MQLQDKTLILRGIFKKLFGIIMHNYNFNLLTDDKNLSVFIVTQKIILRRATF